MKLISAVAAPAACLLLVSCQTRPASTTSGNSSGTDRSYGGTADSTDSCVSSDSPGSDDWGHPPHHPTPYRSRDDERKNASHRTDPRYRDPHHGGSKHGHDAAGHRVDSHGHHVDQFGNHTRTPDVIARDERPHREAAAPSSEPARSSSTEPARPSAPDPSPAASSPAPSSEPAAKSEPAPAAESTSPPDRDHKSGR